MWQTHTQQGSVCVRKWDFDDSYMCIWQTSPPGTLHHNMMLFSEPFRCNIKAKRMAYGPQVFQSCVEYKCVKIYMHADIHLSAAHVNTANIPWNIITLKESWQIRLRQHEDTHTQTHTWVQEGRWSSFHPICPSVWWLCVCVCVAQGGRKLRKSHHSACKAPWDGNHLVFQEVFEKPTHRGFRCVCVCVRWRELPKKKLHGLRTSLDSVTISALFAATVWHSNPGWLVKRLQR